MVEFLQALVSEEVIRGKLSALVVSSEQKDLVRVSDFERVEEKNHLDSVDSSVDVVSKEKVLGLRRVSSQSEDFPCIEELAC